METNLFNDFVLFLRESLTRIFTKSPKLFRIYQFIAMLFLASAKLPWFLNKLNIPIGHIWSTRIEFGITCATTVGIFMARLPVQAKPTVDSTGTIVKTTDSNKLPFTDLQEKKQVFKDLQNAG